ncbi:MAG: hypothetical protein KGJ90_02535 [Patescibacteria group bacterium]|nr:hypothetical protein [Patescibacteria group bacterium]
MRKSTKEELLLRAKRIAIVLDDIDKTELRDLIRAHVDIINARIDRLIEYLGLEEYVEAAKPQETKLQKRVKKWREKK